VPVVLSSDTLFTLVRLEPFPGSALHPDGDRFIFTRSGLNSIEGDDSKPDRFILVQNFFEELRQIAP